MSESAEYIGRNASRRMRGFRPSALQALAVPHAKPGESHKSKKDQKPRPSSTPSPAFADYPRRTSP